MAILGTALAVGQVLKLTTYTYDPDTFQLGLNVSHWEVGVVLGPPPTDADAATMFNTLLETDYKNVLTNTITYAGQGVQIVSGPAIIPVEQRDFSTSGLGAIDADVASNQLAPFASFKSRFAGRSGRGRKYYPFMPETFYQADSTISAAAIALYDLITQKLANVQIVVPAAGGSASLFPIITNATGLPVAAPTIPPYTNRFVIELGTTSERIATQRRRGPFGRVNTPPLP